MKTINYKIVKENYYTIKRFVSENDGVFKLDDDDINFPEGESIEDLKNEVNLILQAFKKPVLKYLP